MQTYLDLIPKDLTGIISNYKNAETNTKLLDDLVYEVLNYFTIDFDRQNERYYGDPEWSHYRSPQDIEYMVSYLNKFIKNRGSKALFQFRAEKEEYPSISEDHQDVTDKLIVDVIELLLTTNIQKTPYFYEKKNAPVIISGMNNLLRRYKSDFRLITYTQGENPRKIEIEIQTKGQILKQFSVPWQ